MHPHFYHWHSRAELKPEVPMLEPRWNAAVKATAEPSASDICSLLTLVLFPGAQPTFAKTFSEAIVKLEPTFPPDHNDELLRVMATAGVYDQLERSTNAADALALGIHAATY